MQSARLPKLKSQLKQYQVNLTNSVLVTLCRAETKVRPAERWHWDLLAVARILARLMRLVRPGIADPSLEARLMHRFFDVLSTGGRHFPVPLRIEGREVLDSVVATHKGFVCCSAHVPLVKLFIPIIRQALGDAEVVVMVRYASEDRHINLWNDRPLPSMEAGPGALVQTRSLLRRGGCLLLLTDKEQGEYISSNIFRFIGMVKSRIIMVFPRLMPDGYVLLRFVEAPAPECRNEEEVQANLEFMAQNVRSILAGDEPVERVRASVMPSVQMTAVDGGREMDRIQLYSRTQLIARVRRLEQLLREESTTLADRSIYEKRLELMRRELEARAKVLSRAEFGPDGRLIKPEGDVLP